MQAGEASRIKLTGIKSLCNYISELMLDEDIDFVAGPIISHWHAIGADALIDNILQHKNRKPSGVIVIAPHAKDGFVITEADFICGSFSAVKFCFWDPGLRDQRSTISRAVELFKRWLNVVLAIRRIKNEDKRGKKQVVIASVMRPNIAFLQLFRDRCLSSKYYPVFSLIDEGLGTYMPTRVRKMVGKLDRQERVPDRFRLARLAVTKVANAGSSLIRIMAAKYINTESLFIFHREKDKLILNKPILNSYRNVIEKRGELHGKIGKAGLLAIIVTQPFSEYGQISLARELDLIDTVVDILVEMGFDVRIKPHPREFTDKYTPVLTKFKSEQVELSHHKMAVESLFPVLEPACVIGYTSTALVTANTMYAVPAISIMDILVNEVESEYLRVAAAAFKLFAEGISYNADTLEKLKQILTSVKLNNASVQPAQGSTH